MKHRSRVRSTIPSNIVYCIPTRYFWTLPWRLGCIEQLDISVREQVRWENIAYIREAGVCEVETNVIYGVATRTQRVRCGGYVTLGVPNDSL